MMLHRHFEEKGKRPNLTTLADVTPRIVKEGEDLFLEEPVEAPKKRGRKPKTAE